MDSNKVLDIDFVDTQVNAGKSYVYRIHSLNLVVGNSIYYDNPTEEPTFVPAMMRASVTINYRCYPRINIIEAPFFEKFVSVMERPPLAPQASFVPLQGIDNQMQILLRSNFGERELQPIKIFAQDQQIINKMIESQPPRTDGLLEYQTDSLPEEFQILRLPHPPQRYEDFAAATFNKTLKTTGRLLVFKDDDYLPNKDYYYCFRAIDKIGISNPSHVYKVRTNSYVNGIYLDIKQYEMRPLHDTKFNLSIKRALKIEPAFDQVALNFEGVDDVDTSEFAVAAPNIEAINIGQSETPVWGKKFKVRLTSKQSGRKIDVNVSFNTEVREETVFPTLQDLDLSAVNAEPCGSTALHVSAGNYGGEVVSMPDQRPPPPSLPAEIDTIFENVSVLSGDGIDVVDNIVDSLVTNLNIDLEADNLSLEANRLAEEAVSILNTATDQGTGPGIFGTPEEPDLAGGLSTDGGYILFENNQNSTPSPSIEMTTQTTNVQVNVNLNRTSTNASTRNYNIPGY